MRTCPNTNPLIDFACAEEIISSGDKSCGRLFGLLINQQMYDRFGPTDRKSLAHAELNELARQTAQQLKPHPRQYHVVQRMWYDEVGLFLSCREVAFRRTISWRQNSKHYETSLVALDQDMDIEFLPGSQHKSDADVITMIQKRNENHERNVFTLYSGKTQAMHPHTVFRTSLRNKMKSHCDGPRRLVVTVVTGGKQPLENGSSLGTVFRQCIIINALEWVAVDIQTVSQQGTPCDKN